MWTKICNFVFWCHSWRSTMFWVTFDFERTFIKRWRCLFHTNILRKMNLPLSYYSIKIWSDNYINIKACSQNRQIHLVKKVSQEVQSRLPFNAYISSLAQKSWQNASNFWQDVSLQDLWYNKETKNVIYLRKCMVNVNVLFCL